MRPESIYMAEEETAAAKQEEMTHQQVSSTSTIIIEPIGRRIPAGGAGDQPMWIRATALMSSPTHRPGDYSRTTAPSLCA